MDRAQAAQICARFDLGTPLAEPRPVAGGRLHRMWRLETTRGRFAIKQLNAQMLERPHIRDWYRLTERVAGALARADVPAAAALDAASGPVQDIGGATVLVYPWVDGGTLPLGSATPSVARQMGTIMGRIHAATATLGLPDLRAPSWEVIPDERWAMRVARTVGRCDAMASLLHGTLGAILAWNQLYTEALPALGQVQVVGHTDLDQKNVLWPTPTTPVIIDWESAGLTDPALDVAGAALAWGGMSAGTPSEEAVKAFVAGYRAAGGHLDGRADIGVRGCIGAWLEWLDFNIERALDEAANSAEERERGHREVLACPDRLRTLAGGRATWAAWLDEDDEDNAGETANHSAQNISICGEE